MESLTLPALTHRRLRNGFRATGPVCHGLLEHQRHRSFLKNSSQLQAITEFSTTHPKKPSHFTRKIQAAINRKTKVNVTSNNRASVCFSGSISDVISLHKEHRIVGKLIGCPAKTPHQSVADGLPLVLSAPEITGL